MIFQWLKKCVSKVKSFFCEDEVKAPPTAKELIGTLESIEDSCLTGNTDTRVLKELMNIADNVSKTPSIRLFSDKSMRVSFLSVTSQGLLGAVSNGYFSKQTVVRSHLISPCATIAPLNEWWSNDESVYYFLIFMKDMVENQLLLYSGNDEMVQRQKEEFIDSYLYRLLVSDYVNLLKIMLMEVSKYEDEERCSSV